jgi:hypothetical protein
MIFTRRDPVAGLLAAVAFRRLLDEPDRPETEDRFLKLFNRRWPTRNRLGFVTDDRPLVFRSSDAPLTYIEIMTWEAGGMRPAHDRPGVIAMWESMKAVGEERAGTELRGQERVYRLDSARLGQLTRGWIDRFDEPVS